MFDKIVIINLPYKKDRKDRLTRHLQDINLFQENTIHWFKAISGDWVNPPKWWKSGNGAWGCYCSHLRIVQDALMEGWENFLVLEDDVVFQPLAREMLKRFIHQLPQDWDQIYLGGQHLIEPTKVLGSPFVRRCRNVNRTHAFALRKRAYARFHQHITNFFDYCANPWWHIDHHLGAAHEKNSWNTYAPSWWICAQEEGSSNISGNNNCRYWWHPSEHAVRLPFIFVNHDRSLPESIRETLHFGYNLKTGTLEDVGLDDCIRDDRDLSCWLLMIAREALDRELLPAIQHSHITQAKVSSLWRAGCYQWETIDISHWTQYATIGFTRSGVSWHPIFSS